VVRKPLKKKQRYTEKRNLTSCVQSCRQVEYYEKSEVILASNNGFAEQDKQEKRQLRSVSGDLGEKSSEIFQRQLIFHDS